MNRLGIMLVGVMSVPNSSQEEKDRLRGEGSGGREHMLESSFPLGREHILNCIKIFH